MLGQTKNIPKKQFLWKSRYLNIINYRFGLVNFLYDIIRLMTKHLAVFTKGVGEKILSGEKTMESRFSSRKIPPFGAISSGDWVYIKTSGEDIIGQFRVQKVFFFDGLSDMDLKTIEKDYGKEISAENSYWEIKKNAKYGTLIFIGEVDPFITAPIKFSKKDLRGWVVLK